MIKAYENFEKSPKILNENFERQQDSKLSYASYFVSYLLNEIKDFSRVNSIILFGSVARGNAGKDSDVDIFIDVNRANKKFEGDVGKIVEGFYSSRECLLFKSKGIDNKINVIVGKINDWPDLKKSIESMGVVLYGAYQAEGVSGRKWTIISWDKIGKNRGAFLNKVYGVKIGGRKYAGLLDEYGGEKIGKSSIMIPVEHGSEFVKLMKKYEVSAKVREVYL